jgi:putative glutamine amidotransferase
VHEIDGHMDHRDRDEDPADVQYAPKHPVDVMPGGVLERLLQQARLQVNSLHGQAVNRLAPGLRVEARAEDGVIEAFSKPDAAGFNLAVQWHPEWQAASNPVSMLLLSAFGKACAAHRDQQNR